MIIGVDFDGTIVEHIYPDIGQPVPDALEVMRECMVQGDKLILWTMRSRQSLKDAVKYLEDEEITLFGINRNPQQHVWTASPKAHCDVYVDDAAIGCPLIYPGDRRLFVDWKEVRILLNTIRNRHMFMHISNNMR